MFTRSLASFPIPRSSLAALQHAGFQHVADLYSLTADQLSDEIKLPSFVCEEILAAVRTASPLLTQSAASLLQPIDSSYSSCKPVDELLGKGGLKKGHILELSGPPSSPKERVVLSLVKSVVEKGGEVIFTDLQNMILPSMLKQELKDTGFSEFVRYFKCYSLSDFMIFMTTLPSFLEEHPKNALLVLSSLSFLFQTTPISNTSKSSLLDQLKTNLAKVCASKHLTVVVTTQLATRMFNAEGSPANFDTGNKAIVVPMLGDTYLPVSKSYRVMIIPDSPRTGLVRLLASPSLSSEKSKAQAVQRPYELVNGRLEAPEC